MEGNGDGIIFRSVGAVYKVVRVQAGSEVLGVYCGTSLSNHLRATWGSSLRLDLADFFATGTKLLS